MIISNVKPLQVTHLSETALNRLADQFQIKLPPEGDTHEIYNPHLVKEQLIILTPTTCLCMQTQFLFSHNTILFVPLVEHYFAFLESYLAIRRKTRTCSLDFHPTESSIDYNTPIIFVFCVNVYNIYYLCDCAALCFNKHESHRIAVSLADHFTSLEGR